MLNSAFLADRFFYGLTFLDSHIKLCNKTRLSDINIISEQFSCELLNILYGYGLVNANEKNGSTVGYDLISETKKLVVQVSSEHRANKVVETLKSIQNTINDRKESFAQIDRLSEEQAQKEQERQEHVEKLVQCEKKIAQYSGQTDGDSRMAAQLTALKRDREALQARIAASDERIDECSHDIKKYQDFIDRTTDLSGYRVMILFLTVDVSNIRKNARVTGLSAYEEIVFDPKTDVLDFASLANHVTKHCLFTETEDRLRQFMEKNSSLFIHREMPKDRVSDVIDEYAGNFESRLFLHKHEENSRVTLQGMYVPPAFSEVVTPGRYPYPKEQIVTGNGNSIGKSRDMVALLCDFLWQKPKNDCERILFVEGHAAIGKTSLVSWICHHYRKLKAKEQIDSVAVEKAIFLNRPVVCVRLRELEFTDCQRSVQLVLNYLDINNIRDFESKYPNAIIILDGADEMSMVSGTAIGSVEEFILDIRRAFSSHKIIVTTRPDFLDMARFISSSFRIRRIMLEHYDHEMRVEWIKKYRACGEEISQNTEDYIVNISDNTAIGVADTPLALYMLARCDMRTELQGNQWSLFHEIFANAIAEAEYNAHFDSFSASRMSRRDISVNYRVVMNIAFRMFQNSREERYYLKERKIDHVIRNSDLNELSPERIRKTCVLCAYWKNTSILGALEFYHNNIRDFFLCEYICEKLRELFSTYGEKGRAEDCSDKLTKLLCEVFCWADINASTWQQTFTFIYLRLKYESIYERNSDSLYSVIRQIDHLPNFIYRLAISKDLWNHKSNEVPYLSAKRVFVNSMLLGRILYEFSEEKEHGNRIRMWTSEEERLNWNEMNLLCDWKEMLQRKVRVSDQESIGIVSNTEFGPVSFRSFDMLDGADFQKCGFTGTMFENAKLCKANFSQSSVQNVSFHNSDLHGANFSEASIFDGTWTNCLNSTDFTGTHIEKMIVHQEKLDSLRFTKSVVKESVFTKCDFTSLLINQNAEFHHVDFSESTISGEIKQSVLYSCNFHLAVFSSNLELNNVHFFGTELNTVRFHGTLRAVVFKDCELRDCDFSRVTLINDVIFENCNLSRASFSKAGLKRVCFVDCILDGADFFQTQMVECAIKGEKTTLHKANFINAHSFQGEMENVDFSAAKIHNAKGFENCMTNRKPVM